MTGEPKKCSLVYYMYIKLSFHLFILDRLTHYDQLLSLLDTFLYFLLILPHTVFICAYIRAPSLVLHIPTLSTDHVIYRVLACVHFALDRKWRHSCFLASDAERFAQNVAKMQIIADRFEPCSVSLSFLLSFHLFPI